MGEPQTQDHLLRVTPLTYVLVVVLALVWAFYRWGPGREAVRRAAADQAAIEAMVKQTNDLYAGVQKIRDDTRALLDPLVFALDLDKSLRADGLPPLTAKYLSDLLAKDNRRLVASGLTKYIDTCGQKEELEKRLFSEGRRGPFKALPGWSEDWQTRCRSIFPPP